MKDVKIPNSTNFVKELYSKMDPTSFQGNNELQPKIIIYLPS
jgi:hypothetical protein